MSATETSATETAEATELFPTPGQTVGPYFGQALPYEGGGDLVPPGRADAIRLHGTVYDGEGTPIPDAMIEIWQPDADGNVVQREGSLHRDGWTFTGWGRVSADAHGHYSFSTVRPGQTDEGRAPFFAVAVFARGLLDRLFTRAYLSDHPALEGDPFLASVPEERRRTLVATADETGYVFDIHLQGDDETVFLDFNPPRAE